MIASGSLSRKILCLALLNAVLLAGVVAVFARSQYRLGEENLLLGPAHDRIVAIANAFNLEFRATPESGHDDLVAAYSRRYRADFYLTDPRGNWLAGPQITLPTKVIQETRRLVAPPRRPDPPPGRGRFGPPPGEGRPRRGGPPRDLLPENERPPDGPDGERPRPPRPLQPPESVALVITRNPTGYWAVARIPLFDAPAFLLIHTSSLWSSDLFFAWKLWLGGALAVAAVCVLCWLPFVRGLTRSIGRMDKATQLIAEGRFDVQVASRRRDELGHLGSQIDRMASRLHSLVTNQKRFLGDIAHELCAPIARIQFALAILEHNAEDSQRRDVAALHDEIQEMSALVNELLSFSKASLRSDAAPLKSVAVATVIERAIAREAFTKATVAACVAPSVTVIANEALLMRAVSNVVRNAVRYAGDAGPITITAEREGGQVRIAVADCGPGLPESELEEVFAPFYRPEAARTRETGGVGLGLAIVRTCMEACQGVVACRNRKPSGLEVVMRLRDAAL